MAVDYSKYVQEAFRFLVRRVLSDTARNGLPADAHYFITFETDRDDVIIPPYVRAKYPEQISIILQHQFENLIVEESYFQVDLAFGGVPTTIRVPYTALIQFADPAADFGFVFTPVHPGEQSDETGKEHAETQGAEVIDLEAMRRK